MKADLPIERWDLPDGFEIPDFSLPIDVDARLATIPEGVTTKGMFLQACRREVEAAGGVFPTDERFYAFHDYPLRRAMELLIETARIVHPGQPMREALRRMGGLTYSIFADSMIGRVIFSAAGRRPGLVYRVAPRAIEAGVSVGKLSVEQLDSQTVVLHASEIHLFTECLPYGMAEGVLLACGRDGLVAQRLASPTEVEIYVHW